MPDRAVVDEALCHECGYKYPAAQVRRYFVVRDGGDEYPDTPLCDGCADEYRIDDDVDSIEEETPQPRALVALSEDRQWLVVRCEETWGIFRWTTQPVVSGMTHAVRPRYEAHQSREDTGQDAHEVLADFLRGRKACDAPRGLPRAR